jgi:hypothetical protein
MSTNIEYFTERDFFSYSVVDTVFGPQLVLTLSKWCLDLTTKYNGELNVDAMCIDFPTQEDLALFKLSLPNHA